MDLSTSLIGWRPFDVVVERNDGARQALPLEAVEHRRGQARQVDLDDLLRAEEFVEATAEMAARFDNDRSRAADVEPHHLEKDGVGALHAVGDHDDLDTPNPQRGARPELEPQSGIDAASADTMTVG